MPDSHVVDVSQVIQFLLLERHVCLSASCSPILWRHQQDLHAVFRPLLSGDGLTADPYSTCHPPPPSPLPPAGYRGGKLFLRWLPCCSLQAGGLGLGEKGRFTRPGSAACTGAGRGVGVRGGQFHGAGAGGATNTHPITYHEGGAAHQITDPTGHQAAARPAGQRPHSSGSVRVGQRRRQSTIIHSCGSSCSPQPPGALPAPQGACRAPHTPTCVHPPVPHSRCLTEVATSCHHMRSRAQAYLNNLRPFQPRDHNICQIGMLICYVWHCGRLACPL